MLLCVRVAVLVGVRGRASRTPAEAERRVTLGGTGAYAWGLQGSYIRPLNQTMAGSTAAPARQPGRLLERCDKRKDKVRSGNIRAAAPNTALKEQINKTIRTNPTAQNEVLIVTIIHCKMPSPYMD